MYNTCDLCCFFSTHKAG